MSSWEDIYKEYDGRYDDLVTRCYNLEQAFNLLMEFWDSLPDGEKPKLHEELLRLGL